MLEGTLDEEEFAPRRRRGLTRMVLGALGLLAGLAGLSMRSLIAALVAAVVAPLTAAPVSLHGSSGSFPAAAGADHYVYVPSAEAGSVTCRVDGEGSVTWQPDRMGLEASVATTDYAQIGRITVASPQQVSISCGGASDVAVVTLGMTGTAGIFVALGLVSLALLVWGAIARRRSRHPRVSGW